MDELKDIFPTEKKVKFGKEEITIKTFVVEDIPVVATILERILATSGDRELDQGLIIKLIISSFSRHFEDVLTLLHTATGLKKERLKAVNIAALTFLIKHVVSENTEFFQQQMLPIIKEMMSGLEGASQETPQADGPK